MHKYILLLTAFILGCSLAAAAQKLQLSLESGAQHSIIADYTGEEEFDNCPPDAGFCGTPSRAEIEHTYNDKPSGYLKGLLLYSVNSRVQLYHNLNASLIRYKQSIYLDIEGAEEGESIAPANDRIGNTGILYLTQELGASYKIVPRLWVSGSVDVMHRLYSQIWVYEMTYESGSSEINFTTKKDTSGKGFEDLQLGMQAGLGYELNDRFSLTTAFQHTFSHNSRPGANLLRLGLQYKLKSW